MADRTVDIKGAKTVHVRGTGHEKTRFTVAISCMADGTKLKPMMISKIKTKPKINFISGVFVHYCNSLLFGSTHDVTSHLQRIQNYAARVILRIPMSSSITIHLKSLHWLPVKVRST